ncbi:MAG: RcsF lipoprotein [Ramlibacter sp.]|nr:RcsF lipoprotein [Ramlibacter sp.]
MLALASCASAPVIEHIVIDDSSAGIRNTVRVLERPVGTVLQQVSARSCKRMSWEPEPSRENAVAQLQIKAARLGASGIADVRCEQETGRELTTNCWSAVVCSATAVKAGP